MSEAHRIYKRGANILLNKIKNSAVNRMISKEKKNKYEISNENIDFTPIE